ncbi:MAG TPA: YCF48-related protein, partial [Ignavibacteria bacterium]|nr:YCF48-related protein [Ignavibacteria bacterium]
MKLLILLLLILFTNESYSEVWESINIPNYEGRINSIYFINETTGFATGVGNIWKTTNKGTNWSSTKVSSPLISYTSLKMSNDSIGYVTGNSGYFMKSTDSGNNWVYIYIPNVDDLYNIYCFSENELLVFGRYGKIVRTTNGGNSWINLSIETVATFRDAIFKNDIGYIVSSNSNFKSLWKSTNKGSNWQEQDIGRDIIGRSICLTNSGFLYILGTEIRIPNFQGIIGRSTNLGISWSFQNFQNPSISFYGMDFADDRVGYCLEAGNPSKIYKTIDSGNSWNKKDSLSQNLSQIYCKNNYVYVYGDSGNIFRAEVNTSNVISMNSII